MQGPNLACLPCRGGPVIQGTKVDKYQFFKTWSIELSISYVSLKSNNIACVEMSYVLAMWLPIVAQ